jgi:DNA repair protein RadD
LARWGLRVGVLRGEDTDYTRKDDVIVASVQTVRSRSAPGWVDFVVVDEVHILHAAHIRLLESWQDKVFIGMSATPLRRGLGRIFTNLVRGPSILALTEQGYLVPARAHVPAQDAIRAALAGVGCGTTTAGYDYREGELGAAMNQRELVGDLVRTWASKGENRPTLAFATNIAHSKAIVQDFSAAGVSAGTLTPIPRPASAAPSSALFARGRSGCSVL